MKYSTSARSPLSPTRWPRDAFRWWASLGTALLVALAVVVPTYAVLLAFVVLDPHALRIDRAHPALPWPLLVVQLVSYAGGVTVLLLLLPVLAHRSLRDLGLRAPRASDLMWGLGGAVAMVIATVAAGAVQDALVHVKADEEQVEYLRNARGSAIAGFVFLACVAAPFTEELVFRGFIFNALRRYMPAVAAVLVSGVLFGAVHVFGAAHLQYGVVAPLAAAGIVLAVVYYRSGSLVASMVTHALFNLFTVVAVLGFHQKA